MFLPSHGRRIYCTPECGRLANIAMAKVSPARQASHRRAALAYQARHKAAGLCHACPLPARPGLVSCEAHA